MFFLILLIINNYIQEKRGRNKLPKMISKDYISNKIEDNHIIFPYKNKKLMMKILTIKVQLKIIKTKFWNCKKK